MKKRLAIIILFIIMLSYAVPTCAAGGWTAHIEDPKDSVQENEFMEVVNVPASEHYSGAASKAGYIQFARTNKDKNTYFYLEYNLDGKLSSGSAYDFSFYAKGDFTAQTVYAGIGTNEATKTGGMIQLFNTRFSKEPKSNDWTKYSISGFVYDGTGEHFRVKVMQLCNALYIDDVVLTASGGGENLIADGGFEKASFVETNDPGNSESYAPSSISVTQRAGHIILGWRNPKNTNLSKVSIFDITDGEETLVTDTLSKTAEAYVNYDIKNLEEGKNYTFKVVCSFGKTTATETILSGTASEIKPVTLMNMSYQGAHPGTAYLDHNDAHGGKGALRVISNLPSWTSNNYINLDTDSISFSDSDIYEVSVWIKGRFDSATTEAKNINYKDMLRPDWSNFKVFSASEPDENGWINVVYTASEIGSCPLKILAEYRTDLLVDDIEVWKMADGERFSQIFKQDFESRNAEMTDVSDLSAEFNRNMAKISWKAPQNAKYVRVYVKDEEKLSLRAEVFADINCITFNQLKNDHIYNYVVKAVDGNNNESDGVEITVTPTPDDYECLEYGLYKNDILRNDFYGNSTFVAKAMLKNNKIADGLNAQIIAVLRKDGERIDATASAVTQIPKTKYDEAGQEIKTNITVPDVSDGEYELSVYLWDGLGNMNILAPFKLYKEGNDY